MPTKPVNLVEVANVGSLPLGLRAVAALDYSGVAPPANLRAIGATWGSLGTVWKDANVRWGAVRYAAGAATPARLERIAAVVPDTT